MQSYNTKYATHAQEEIVQQHKQINKSTSLINNKLYQAETPETSAGKCSPVLVVCKLGGVIQILKSKTVQIKSD